MPNHYEAALDAKAEEYRRAAELAGEQGDERGHSLNLMCASMLGDMLRALGRAEHSGRKGLLQKIAGEASARSEAALARGDYDTADRERIKAETILWARDRLYEAEAEDEQHTGPV